MHLCLCLRLHLIYYRDVVGFLTIVFGRPRSVNKVLGCSNGRAGGNNRLGTRAFRRGDSGGDPLCPRASSGWTLKPERSPWARKYPAGAWRTPTRRPNHRSHKAAAPSSTGIFAMNNRTSCPAVRVARTCTILHHLRVATRSFGGSA